MDNKVSYRTFLKVWKDNKAFFETEFKIILPEILPATLKFLKYNYTTEQKKFIYYYFYLNPELVISSHSFNFLYLNGVFEIVGKNKEIFARIFKCSEDMLIKNIQIEWQKNNLKDNDNVLLIYEFPNISHSQILKLENCINKGILKMKIEEKLPEKNHKVKGKKI